MPEEQEKPEWSAQRTLIDGKVFEATYMKNCPGAFFRIFHNYGKGNITIGTYRSPHEQPHEEPTSLRKLSQMEKDLLRLSMGEFKRKYPTVDILDIHQTHEQIEEEMNKDLKLMFDLAGIPED